MLSQLLKRIRFLFYQQPKEKREAHTFHTINGVFRDWATSTVEDIPPPYTDALESKTVFVDTKRYLPPPVADPCLRICPHETVSFEGLQKIANALAISNTGATIDALTPACHKHCGQSGPDAKNAKSVCASSPGLLRGFGTYTSEGSKDPSQTPVVILCFNWDLGILDGIRAQVETAAELQYFLSAQGVWLCPHKRISDSDIVNAIYGFVKRQRRRKVVTGCDRCNTEIKILTKMEGDDETIRVTTKRYLGTAAKANDSLWLSQCSV